MTKTPGLAPSLVLRVGIVGHRRARLGAADRGLLQGRIGDVLGCLAEVARTIQGEQNGLAGRALTAPAEAPTLRFATSLAEGSETFAASAAVARGFRLDLILPFPFETCIEALEGQAKQAFEEIWQAPDGTVVNTRLQLEGPWKPSDRGAYLSVGRLLLAHSDVVLAVWDQGDGGAGPADDGTDVTTEIVREAQRRGLVVVLVTLSGGIRLWEPSPSAADPAEDGEWAPIACDSDPVPARNALSERTSALLRPPHGDAAERIRAFYGERLRERSGHFGYSLLRALFRDGNGARWQAVRALCPGARWPSVDYGLARNRSQAWPMTRKLAEELGDERFTRAVDGVLRERWIAADNLAIHYSHAYRSTYIANFFLAAVSVFVGLLAVLFWTSHFSLEWKGFWIFLELLLIWIILRSTARARRAGWHLLWLHYRSLAEALRPARLPILMGSSPLRTGEAVGPTSDAAWIAWYVRATLREIAPPSTLIGPGELARVIDVAVEEEIAEQIDYHERTAEALSSLEHKLHKAGEWMLWLTIASGSVYLVLYAFGLAVDGSQAAYLFKAPATILGAALPAFGAACFGIRAIGDFRAAARQSKLMIRELQEVRDLLAAERRMPRRPRVRRALAELIHTLSDDLKLWRMIYSEREIVAGPH